MTAAPQVAGAPSTGQTGSSDVERGQLATEVRRLLAAHAPPARLREFVDAEPATREFDRALWRRMVEMGLAGLAIPGEYGGTGSGLTELALVIEQLGRTLTPTPLLSSTGLGAGALLCLDDEPARRELLPRAASGDLVLAYAPLRGGSGARCRPDGDRWRLDGSADLVIDGASADVVVVEAADPDRRVRYFAVAVFSVKPSAVVSPLAVSPVVVSSAVVSGATPTVRVRPLAGSDPTRAAARLELTACPVTELACVDPAAARRRLHDRAALLVAAEQLGGLTRCVELTVDYARTRTQFGRTIGSFQAVKHRCADMHVRAELAAALVRDATRAADGEPGAAGLAAFAARSYCDDAYAWIAASMIQVHGGIGCTWEHDAHLYYKRARATPHLLGPPSATGDGLAERLDEAEGNGTFATTSGTG